MNDSIGDVRVKVKVTTNGHVYWHEPLTLIAKDECVCVKNEIHRAAWRVKVRGGDLDVRSRS